MWRSTSPDHCIYERFSPEMRLVLACATTQAHAGRIRDSLDVGSLDWNRVVRLASRHHVASLLYANLNKAFASRVPAASLAALKQNSVLIAQRNMFLVAELLMTLRRFAQEGISAIPFKGPMLATSVYRNMGLRCCGDLDLLVKPEDAIRAKNILVGAGLRPEFPTSTPEEIKYLLSMNEQQEREYFRIHWEYHLVRQDGLNIDMHWRIMPPEVALDLDEARMWERAGSVKLGGLDVPNLSSEDLLLMLCANGTKDTWCRLDRLCDISELLRTNPEMDWGYVLNSAGRMGGRRMIFVGLALARELMDAPVPLAIRRQIARDSGIRSLVSLICSRLASEQEDLEAIPTRVEAAFRLRVRERLSDRLRYCLSYVTPSVGDWTAVQLPRSLSFLYFLMRPVRLLVKFGPMVRARPSAMR